MSLKNYWMFFGIFGFAVNVLLGVGCMKIFKVEPMYCFNFYTGVVILIFGFYKALFT